MADKRPPGFNVDLGFYDSAEVLSIPRKYRAAAVGVWTLCGSYAAQKMSDGYVSATALKELGCTDLIRTLLMSTRNSRGLPSPLWVGADDGAIQFTNWPKWQRTAQEIKDYREAEAERKRQEREAKRKAREAHVSATSASREAHVSGTYRLRDDHVPQDVNAASAPREDAEPTVTSNDSEMSGRTKPGRPSDVRPESEQTKTKTETETKTEITTPLTLGEGGPGGEPANLPVAAKAAPARDRRGTRLPDDWRPSDQTISAMRQQFPTVDLKAIYDEFRDYWRAVPGAKGRKLDWDATWRNRVREIAGRQRAPGTTNGHPTIGKPTQKALGWEAAGNELIAEMERQ